MIFSKAIFAFQTLQVQLSPGAPSLKPTCWTVRTKAIEAVLSNYEVLTTAPINILENGRDEYALKAGLMDIPLPLTDLMIVKSILDNSTMKLLKLQVN